MKKDKKRIIIIFPYELYENLQEYAKINYLTINQVVRTIIKDFLDDYLLKRVK